MINPLLYNKYLSWSVRMTGAGTVVTPKTTRQENVPNPAGVAWGHVTAGQLLFLGYRLRFQAAAAGDGVAFVDRRPAAGAVPLLNSPLFSVLANAAGRFDSGSADIFVPLGPGEIVGANVFLAGQLELEVVGGATNIEVVAWGIYCEEATYKPLRGAVNLE